MPRTIYVEVPVHLRPIRSDGEPEADGKPLDSLDAGDKLEFARSSRDGQFLLGRVTYIASGKFAADRIGVEGYVWSKAVRIEPVPAPKPAFPFAMLLGAAALVVILAALVRCSAG